MFSKDEFSAVLAARQRLDIGDHATAQSMDRSDTAAQRERRLVCSHPVPSLLRRQRATPARPFWGCPLSIVRLIERDVRVHGFSALISLLAATLRCCTSGKSASR